MYDRVKSEFIMVPKGENTLRFSLIEFDIMLNGIVPISSTRRNPNLPNVVKFGFLPTIPKIKISVDF